MASATYLCKKCNKFTRKNKVKQDGVYDHKCTKCGHTNKLHIKVKMYDFGPVPSIERVE